MQIQLDSTDEVYCPGRLVKGRLLLDHSEALEEECRISITLSGTSEAEYWDGDGQEWNQAPLFKSELLLYTGDSPISDMPPTGWPFVFAFPRTPMPIEKDKQRFRRGRWDYGPSKPLPPSFHFQEKTNAIFTIEYGLDAEYIPCRSANRQKKTATHHIPLLFRGCRPEETPAGDGQIPRLMLDSFAFKGAYIQPEPRPPTLGGKMWSRLGHVSKGRAAFQLETRATTEIIQGSIVPISLTLRYKPELSCAAQPPPIYLRSFSVVVKATMASGGLEWTHETTVMDMRKLKVSLEDGEPLEIGHLLDISTESLGVYDFESYNVQRTHTLKLCFSVSDEVQRVDLKQKASLKILSPWFYEERPPDISQGM